MLYELEKIRNDRKYITSRLEENNRRLSELLQDEKVSEYLRIMKDSEILRSFLQINEANLRYSEMGKCEHIYVVTDEVEDDSYCDGVAKVYHCLKCGLTNEYEVKNIDVSSLDTDQLGMFRLFKESAFESFVIGDEIYSLELAKTIYQTITNENPNISNAELELRFLESYLQYTSGKQNEEKQGQNVSNSTAVSSESGSLLAQITYEQENQEIDSAISTLNLIYQEQETQEQETPKTKKLIPTIKKFIFPRR